MIPDTDKIVKGEVLSFTLDNNLDQLDNLHAMTKGFGDVHGLGKRTIFETNLVLEEVFTNIIAYGHGDKNGHQVQFSLEYNKNCIIIDIEDDGIPFNLLEADPAELDTGLEHRSVGGLGIHLIRNFMNDVTYQRIGSKNVVTLKKNCKDIEE